MDLNWCKGINQVLTFEQLAEKASEEIGYKVEAYDLGSSENFMEYTREGVCCAY